MSADILRRAAAVLRERAEAATPGPWEAMEHDSNPGDEGVCLLGAAATVTGSHMIGYFHVLSQAEQEANGAYAATMHPGVGLAIADWLQLEADRLGWLENHATPQAVVLARLILWDATA